MSFKDIYLNNNYEVNDEFTFTLKEITKYKQNKIFKRNFSIITAFNPNNELLRCIQNQDRNLDLKNDIKEFEFMFCRGYLDDHSEDGFLIFDITFEEAIKLALKYEQYAIFYNDCKKDICGYFEVKTKNLIV